MRTTRLLGPIAATLAMASAGSPAAQVGREVGQHFPDLELPTVQRDRTVRLSDFRGKRVLLIEFASW